jgi:hypothetical protein
MQPSLWDSSFSKVAESWNLAKENMNSLKGGPKYD